MVQSQNAKVEYSASATFLSGIFSYGKVLLGDKSFEFYNDRNPQDFIQIPWTEIDHVEVSVLFGGRVLPRFCIITREGSKFAFSCRDNKACLRAMRQHVPEDRLVRALSPIDVVKGLLRSRAR
ncbi:DUF956 family protein [Collinsella sp. AGMB00827]|uniref:DUF956 family protein n=1 Tax=Collinsella ureilytica TaxID=2869515 RepID=A0ABS7MI43_9ACTN|nr:DUF956 family protein [Collinsella urealyticum]MBY4797028.1 DUF956 family protein [Collinsella urealyticum]